jgi:hypothetical protein
MCGILLLCVLALAPARAFAQHGAAGARGGGARAGAVRAPQAPAARAPTPTVSRPGAASAVIIRPITSRPTSIAMGVNPVTTFRTPLPSGIRLPFRPPLRFPPRPIGPFFGSGNFGGFGFNPFFFPSCNPFWGMGFGCGLLAPYYGIGYGPAVSYPAGPAYPSEPPYPSDPVYSPPEPSATLQYTPLVNQYPSLSTLPGQDLTAPGGAGAPLRNEMLLYLQDGSVFAVASYTVSDGELHYVTAYGGRNNVAVGFLDLQKTIEANAARGVAFTLTPGPAAASGASAPSPLGPAPAPPGPITPSK